MKRMIQLVCLILAALFCTGCGKQEQPMEGICYQIYEINKSDTQLSTREFFSEEEDVEKLLYLLLEQLQTLPENAELRAAIPEGVSLQKAVLADETATLSFASDYNSLSQTGEVLTRAAVVRTLTQVEGISYVNFLLEGDALMNSLGNPVGMMTADQFIDNSGNEINTEEMATLTLYFANATGDGLKKVTREVVYNSNISLEKLVMEQLTAGPYEEEEALPVINPATKTLTATISDGICYLNMDDNFLQQPENITAEVAIFSIVNSLVELPDVNKVQFSINGENEIMYREMFSLSNYFERNLELVTQ